ncbi:MAG: hypothetical protein ACI9WU_000072 [Myxococcota bacterium]|jgi:hypothetical protein
MLPGTVERQEARAMAGLALHDGLSADAARCRDAARPERVRQRTCYSQRWRLVIHPDLPLLAEAGMDAKRAHQLLIG